MKKRVFILLPLLLLFLLGLGLVAYPIVSSYYTEKHQSQVHTQYQEVLERADSREIEEARTAAESYNQLRKRRLIMNCWLPALLPLNWILWTTTAF